MADQLPSSVDPVTGADWSALQFLQALRVDSSRLDDSLQEIRAKLGIPSVPVISNDGITITGVTQAAGGAQVVLTWESDRTDVLRWMAGRDGIDLAGNGPTEFWASYSGPTVRSCEFGNLQPSKTYRLYLYGQTLEGVTDRLIATFTTRAADDPGDPLNFSFNMTATAISERQIRLDAVYPETEYGSNIWIRSFERHGAPDRNGETDEVRNVSGGWGPGDAIESNFDDLLPETTHTVVIAGEVSDGRSFREEVQVTTLAVPGGGDGSITLTAVPLGAVAIQVDWDTARTDVIAWTVAASPVGGGSEGTPQVELSDPNARSCTLQWSHWPEHGAYNVILRGVTPTGNLPVVTVQVTLPPIEDTPDGIQAAAVYGWGSVLEGDEFEGTGLDTEKWVASDGPTSNGLETYSPSVVSVADGVLTVSSDVSLDQVGCVTWSGSGRKRGRYEVRMRLRTVGPEPTPGTVYPYTGAVKLMSESADDYNYNWALGSCGYEQIAAYFSVANGNDVGQVSRSIVTSEWHNYGVEVGPDYVRGYIDGMLWYDNTDSAATVESLEPMRPVIELSDPFYGPGYQRHTGAIDVAWIRLYGDPSHNDVEIED